MEENVKGETLIFLVFLLAVVLYLVVNTFQYLIFGHYTFGVVGLCKMTFGC